MAALVVAALMAVAAYRLLRDSARVFLEASPRGIEPGAVEAGDPRASTAVTDVHELHVWEVTSGFPALSAHVLVDAGADCHERRLAIEGLLERGSGSSTPRSRSTTATTCCPRPRSSAGSTRSGTDSTERRASADAGWQTADAGQRGAGE